MRSTSSVHRASTAIQANQIWPNSSGFRPNLNILLLAKMIANATAKSTQKRKASQFDEDSLSNKRTRASDGSITQNSTELKYTYPFAEALHSIFVKADTVPVLRHVLDIQYVHGDAEDVAFRDILKSSSESQVDLGEILLGRYRGRFIGLSAEDRTWLLLIPSLSIDADTNDLQNSGAHDLLVACRILQESGYARFRASLRVTTFPELSLQLEIVASIAIPELLNFEIRKGTLKKTITALEDARRRLLRAAYVPEDVVSTVVKQSITVSSFYNILGPAPALPSAAAERAIQCEGLLPSLLPFQRRSVAWLLEREGMKLTPEGTLVPQSLVNAFSFWQEVREGNHVWYMNRLSGELAEEVPELPNVHGGMLAEEPGLGKTVETIALILMNPAPPEWNPTQSRWDEISCLDAKAVKVRANPVKFMLQTISTCICIYRRHL